ncbi:MAG: HEAT repeat domain-containing protein, partial [Planctomycetota bacterium]
PALGRSGTQGMLRETTDQAGLAPVRLATGADSGLTRAAREILTQLGKTRRLDEPVALQAVETLLSLGDPGLSAARLAVASDHAPTMLAAVRVLLRSGRPEDAEHVVRRLRTKMPTRAGSAAVMELIALDPVRATPRLLCELLEHTQAPVRLAAHHALDDAPARALLPLLAPVLHSSRADSRYKAVDLLAAIPGPESLALLLETLNDGQARVAKRVVDALANSDDSKIETLLLTRAFGERWVLRPGAYAILALIEREDRLLQPTLHEQHVEQLLRGLGSNDDFISGVCASALAGIGFRSETPENSPWLDTEVPVRLVEVVSGFRFFDDYESLKDTALRRLKQISGVSHGSDGPAWAAWWLGTQDTFRSSRAVMRVPEDSERGMRVAFRDGSSGTAFVLLGPDQAPVGAPARLGEALYLSQAEARDLLELLRSVGVFGVDRLPGSRGSQPNEGRALEVNIAGQGKKFVFGQGFSEPWFDQVAGMVIALQERNRWQRFPHPRKHGTRLALYRAEGAWWSGDHDEHERDLRLKQLVLDQLLALQPTEREHGLDTLEELYASLPLVEPVDFPILLQILEEEFYYTERADRVLNLVRIAAGLGPQATDAERAETVPQAMVERAWLIVRLLHDRFSSDASSAIGAVLVAAGDEMIRAAASDPRPLIRAVSAFVLAQEPDEHDVGVLLALLDDPIIEVEVAAVQALGRARVEAAREPLLVRAGMGQAEVRTVALLALGRMGGDDARAVLLTSLSDQDGRFRKAATEGLASLGDPATAAVLLSILGAGGYPEVLPAARRGLLALGEDGWDDLFLAMRSPSPTLRREAGLLLARQGVPHAAPALMRALAEDPANSQIARELTVLTCVDKRAEVDPAEAWYRWWDGVRHDDSLLWYRSACEALGIKTPPNEAFAEGGSRDAVAFLVEIMRRQESWLVERSQRELERLLGRDLGAVPPRGKERDAWLTTLLEVLDEGR